MLRAYHELIGELLPTYSGTLEHFAVTLIGQRVFAAAEDSLDASLLGELELKGFGRAIPAYEVHGLRSRGG